MYEVYACCYNVNAIKNIEYIKRLTRNSNEINIWPTEM